MYQTDNSCVCCGTCHRFIFKTGKLKSVTPSPTESTVRDANPRQQFPSANDRLMQASQKPDLVILSRNCFVKARNWVWAAGHHGGPHFLLSSCRSGGSTALARKQRPQEEPLMASWGLSAGTGLKNQLWSGTAQTD